MNRYKVLTDGEKLEELQRVPEWRIGDGKLCRQVNLSTYLEAFALSEKIGALVEKLNHHPDIVIGYKKLKIEFYTHDRADQLTYADFDAAVEVEKLFHH